MRAVDKRPGMKATAASVGGWYPLPEGMPDPCEVTILNWLPGDQEMTVEDQAGHRWKVLHWLVDAGYEFPSKGGIYLHESEPRILDRLQRVVAGELGAYPDEFLAMARKILRRNGRGELAS
jgi:hypothetical protein